jgi:hypothetical protein
LSDLARDRATEFGRICHEGVGHKGDIREAALGRLGMSGAACILRENWQQPEIGAMTDTRLDANLGCDSGDRERAQAAVPQDDRQRRAFEGRTMAEPVAMRTEVDRELDEITKDGAAKTVLDEIEATEPKPNSCHLALKPTAPSLR